MEEKLEILQNIMHTALISESISSLAATLGYKSRATLYRILDGSASSNAVNDFYRKVETTLFLSGETLSNISSTINNVSRLNRILKSESNDFKTFTTFDVVKAFISHDYSIFSDEFKREELPGLQRWEKIEPDAFFAMLAYFYFKSLRINFYEGGKNHKQRCAELLEPIGEKLIELYPANAVAAESVYIYSRSDLLNVEASILWNFITSLATMLQYFGTPDLGNIIAKNKLLVPFLYDRTYWRGNDQSELILIRAVRHNIPGSGYYDIFMIEPDSGKVENISTMTFLSDMIVCYRDKLSGNTKLAIYQIDDEFLGFEWENEDACPSLFEHHWKALSLQTSWQLRELNSHLSDEVLNEAALRADGYMSLPGYSVVNVNMSRSGVRLFLINGCIYEIAYSVAPFLEYIRPSNIVIIAEQMSNGEIFVSWPQLMHCIPLRLFTRIK